MEIETQIAATRAALELAREKHAESADAMADASASPHEFDRHRIERDRHGADVERLMLLLGKMEIQLADERAALKMQQRAEIEHEAELLERKIAGLSYDGEQLVARHLGRIVREIEASRIRALELSAQIDPRQVYAIAPEPIALYEATAGAVNALRRCCPFSKKPMVTELQLVLPEEPDDADEAA
jgi:hypothetical protein